MKCTALCTSFYSETNYASASLLKVGGVCTRCALIYRRARAAGLSWEAMFLWDTEVAADGALGQRARKACWVRYGAESVSPGLVDPALHLVMIPKSINHAWQSLSSRMPRDSWGSNHGIVTSSL